MESLHFRHSLTMELRHVEQAAQVVLHTICFHRLLGTVRPAYIEAFGMTFPAIADAEVDALIRQRSIQLLSLLQSLPSPARLQMVVYFLRPSNKPPATTYTGETTQPRPKPDTTDKTSGLTHAASSLRAWASPRNYPYGWLAQAFSSGAGQPAGTFIAPAEPDLDKEAFETWSISFSLVNRAESVQTELAGFVEQTMRFVGENKAHLPPITSGEVCTFPMRILVKAAD